MEPGVYVLVIFGGAAGIRIGSRGEIPFPEGYYGYVGSARGPGGLARVIRHIRLSKNRDKRPRWHIDYLLIHPGFRLVQVYCAVTRDRLECSLATAIALPSIPGFGSSDCSCPSHLFYASTDPSGILLAAFEKNGLIPGIVIPDDPDSQSPLHGE